MSRILAVGAHPDDVEIAIGGMLIKAARQGAEVTVLDLTEGELASRGTLEERRSEAAEAAELVGARRRTAGLRDGFLADTVEQRERVAAHIRELRPDVLLGPLPDRHPDHGAAGALAKSANFYAGLVRYPVEGEPHRAAATLFYAIHHTQERPACVVDVTGEWEDKIRALKAFRSQLHNPEYEGEATYVASEAFWSSITQRAAYWGSWIGVDYGEPLFSEGPLRMEGIPGVTS